MAAKRGAEIIDLHNFAGHADGRKNLTYIRSRERISNSVVYVSNYGSVQDSLRPCSSGKGRQYDCTSSGVISLFIRWSDQSVENSMDDQLDLDNFRSFPFRGRSK